MCLCISVSVSDRLCLCASVRLCACTVCVCASVCLRVVPVSVLHQLFLQLWLHVPTYIRQSPDTNVSFEMLYVFTFVSKQTKFIIFKTTLIILYPKACSQRRPKSRYQYDIFKCHVLHSCSEKMSLPRPCASGNVDFWN